jgi:hypothetical protein
MGVQGISSNYMDAVLQMAQQTQSRVFLNLMNVQKVAIESVAHPLRPIGPSGAMVDTYA